MAIERFFTTTFAVTRMTWSNESAAEASVGTFKGHIQQVSPEDAKVIGEAFGKSFTVWCAKSEDVESGDTFTIATGDYAGTYSVKSIQLNATGASQHLEIMVVKDF